MEQKETSRKVLAAVFFVVGIILLIGFIFVIGRDKGLTQSKFQVVVLYKNVGGLLEGSPVRLSGVNVGTVDKIDFLEEEKDGRKVKVVLNIFSKFKKQMLVCNRFAIVTEGLLGEKLIEIDTVENSQSLDLKNPVMGVDPLDVQDFADIFFQAAESFTNTSDKLSKLDVEELSRIMTDSAQALKGTAAGFNAVLAELQDITKKSKRMFNRLEQRIIQGNLFKVF